MVKSSNSYGASEQLNAIFAERWDEPALICDSCQFSYRELYGHAAGIAAWLAEQGCQARDAVAMLLPNGWPFAVTYLACLVGGYRIVPVNPELNSEDQAYILSSTVPKILVDDPRLLADLPPLAADAPNFVYPDEIVAAIFFTSGSTGKPKGVCHSLDALVANALSFNASLGINVGTRQYHVLPMAYMAGFLNTLLSPWMAGGVVLLGPRFRPVDALQFWQRPLQWNANAIWLTPTLAAVLVRVSRDPQVASRVGLCLEHVFCGTAPLPMATRKSFYDVFGVHLQESYGMSEVLLVAAQTRDEAARLTGVGRLLPSVKVETRTVPDLCAEELIIHAPWTLKGYLLEGGESSPLLNDGGMPSGDQGMVDGQQLVITGRLKDLIIRGGLNVSPLAVEEVLLREGGVEDAAVVGLPHDFWGEMIVACLVAGGGADPQTLQEALQARCLSELGDGMRPDKYIWLDTLPRASTGKIQKHVLRERLA
jgi:acyl-CoA synthetase (AMP-forming)/AMP-acid ligase II